MLASQLGPLCRSELSVGNPSQLAPLDVESQASPANSSHRNGRGEHVNLLSVNSKTVPNPYPFS